MVRRSNSGNGSTLQPPRWHRVRAPHPKTDTTVALATAGSVQCRQCASWSYTFLLQSEEANGFSTKTSQGLTSAARAFEHGVEQHVGAASIHSSEASSISL